ncbi:ATP-dependent helicase [Rhodobacter sp. 24-YEA-8]|uniref:ATP-dependent helicase n=1 Tax=Rhodobacter sp. 24-YEA-8 TaxID=1884310 RepID=UPI00089BA538|nr:UvrD-helicase domain-containing protein [Rhodobacter sp. 24-YEA-8]SEC09298.1 ATP-dependent DNA helicase, Rep family [Rhodobacter sp. 24-YEA-8]
MDPWDDHEAFEAAAAPVPLSQRALAARPKPYLDGLNPAQLEAVLTLDGPVLMLAGAGTGKTKALTARIVHLMREGRARSNEILAVTFTNKAAREMKSRVEAMNQSESGMPWMGTFHSLSVKILRRHAELAGLKPSFTILDTDDQLRLLKQLIQAANMDDKRWPPRMLAGLIDTWKNRAWTPDKVPSSEAGAYDNKGTELYAQYQERLRTLNACDFGDLLLHCVTIFRAHPDVLAQYQRWFKYILVDEYQDTNVCQYLWLRLLAQGHQNICCVGDDDQSIYGWRGAEVGNILKFEKDFPGAKVIRLEQNYRSTPHILAAASAVIRGNANRLGKTLWTEAEEGEKVRLTGYWDGEEEARAIGEEIEALARGTRGHLPVGLNSQAILVRASHQMRAFEDRFLTIGLPYRVIGGPRFYERQEIRDAMAYFRLAVSPEDDLAFERVVNLPKRGLGEKATASIRAEARRIGMSQQEGARSLVSTGGIGGKGAGQLRQFVEGIDYWHWWIVNRGNQNVIENYELDLENLEAEAFQLNRSITDITHPENMLADLIEQLKVCRAKISLVNRNIEILKGNHSLLAELILDESGYTTMWQNAEKDKNPDAEGRLENLKELVKALEQFDSLQGFLEHVALVMENDSEEAAEKVSIMTLHGAKGLEFPAVFLPGWEEGLFPSQRSMDESGQKGIEEERRLAYVGITRAEELCYISFASNRRVYGQWQSQMASRFVDELPVADVDVLTPPGLMGGGYGAAASGGFAGDFGGGGFGSDIEARATKADVYNSPGWRRLQSNAGPRPATPRRQVTIDLEALSGFSVGDRVFNQKFGYGRILDMEADTFEVDFEKAGVKHVKAGFVTAASKDDEIPF